MEKKTLKLITQRVLEYSKDPTHQGRAKEELDTHLEALAEVFGVSIKEVTEISNQVLASQKDKKQLKNYLSDHYWKYLLGGLLLIALLILFFLLGKVQYLESGTVPSQFTTGSLSNSLPLNSTNSIQNNTLYVHKAIFSQILASIMPLRMSMMEFFQMEGMYPSRLEEMGLDREDMKSGKYILDIKLADHGKIIIKATEQLGDNIHITYAPIEVMGGLNIEWRCKTNYQQSKLYACEQIDTEVLLADEK